MAPKRSRKRTAQTENDNAGCLWGLISLFDFRRGYSARKLLLYRKRESGRNAGIGNSKSKPDSLGRYANSHEDADYLDEKGAEKISSGMASVKALMEEEMSREHSLKKIPSEEVELMMSNLGVEVHSKKNRSQESKTCKVVNNLTSPASSDSCQIDSLSQIEKSSLNSDMAAFLMDFLSYNNQSQESNMDVKSKIDIHADLKAIGHRVHNHLDESGSQFDQKHSILQKALSNVAEVFIRQNYIDGKEHAIKRAVQSKEFVDALEVLNSNKELIKKLLQDPDSSLLNHVQDLQNTWLRELSKLESGNLLEKTESSGEEISSPGMCKEPGSNELFHKQSRHNFFWQKDKSKGTKPASTSERIVVLKPCPARIESPSIMTIQTSSVLSNLKSKHQEDGERVVSHFSLKEIKRKLRHFVSMDGILHRIPYGSKDLGDVGEHIDGKTIAKSLTSKTSWNPENGAQHLVISKKKDKKTKPKDCQLNVKDDIVPPRFKSFCYEEAKKHLAEMLDTGEQISNSPNGKVTKSLGRIISLPEYNLLSPRFSPGRDKEPILSPQQAKFCSSQQLQQEDATEDINLLRPNSESAAYTTSSPSNETQTLDPKTELIDTQTQEGIYIGEDSKAKGSTEIAEVVDIINSDESSIFHIPSESNCSEAIVVSERCQEEGSSTPSGLGPLEEKSEPVVTSESTSPRSFFEQNIEAPESVTEKKIEKPSPVSVFDAPFSEDITSPECSAAEHPEVCIQPRHILFEEHDKTSIPLTSSDYASNLRTHLDENEARVSYIRAVLEATGLITDQFSERWHSVDQLLDPSLFDEVRSPYNPLPEDPKLLFDCINEVLLEIHDRFFRYTYQLSFVKANVRPVPIGENFIQEVTRGVNWHLRTQFPGTLEEIVRKDLEGRSWMDHRFETESIVIEMWNTILEDLMEETALELWV